MGEAGGGRHSWPSGQRGAGHHSQVRPQIDSVASPQGSGLRAGSRVSVLVSRLRLAEGRWSL